MRGLCWDWVAPGPSPSSPSGVVFNTLPGVPCQVTVPTWGCGVTRWFLVKILGSDALALRRQVFHAWLVLAGSEEEGELSLFQTREQMHVSVQPAGAAHMQHKHTCTQAHAHAPSQEHVVQSRSSSQLSHFTLDKSSWPQICSQPTLCWPSPFQQIVKRAISFLLCL